METIDILVRLSLAVLLGGIVGIERTMAGKAAGMRTYALVSMGSALFVIISQIVELTSDYDPLRMASQIVVGIGFIGAGLVVYNNNKTSGLTSAAGLWVAAGIGMAIGFDLVNLAVIGTVMTLLVFTILWKIEHFLAHFGYKNRVEDGSVENEEEVGNGTRR